MSKETKSVITQADCHNTLLKQAKAMLPLQVALMICDALSILLLCAATGSFSYAWVITLPMIAFLAVAGIVSVLHCVNTFRTAEIGHFEVVLDELVDMREETVRRYRRGHVTYRTEIVFYFRDHGRYILSGKDGNAYDYSSVGDGFYVVIGRHSKKRTPILVFNARIYEYRE